MNTINWEDIQRDHDEGALMVLKTLNKDYYCINNKTHEYVVFDESTKLWKKYNFGQMVDRITGQCKALMDELYEKHKITFYKNLRKRFGNNLTDNIVRKLSSKPEVFKPHFGCKLNKIPYLVSFKDGVLNLKTMKFEKRTKDHLMSKCLSYNYPSHLTEDHEDVQKVKQILLKICNNNEEDFAAMLRTYGYMMTGETKEQIFNYFYGAQGSNGKTLSVTAFKNAFEFYCYEMNPKAFEDDAQKAHKFFAKTEDCRAVFVNELRQDKKIDASLIKDVRDGKNKEFEKLFDTTYNLTIQFKLTFISNHPPNIIGDGGIQRSINLFEFLSKFVSKGDRNYEKPDDSKLIFEKDKNLENVVEKQWFKKAFCFLVIQEAHKYYKEGLIPFPKYHKETATSLLEANDELLRFIDNHYDITNNRDDRVARDEFLEHYREVSGKRKTSWLYVLSKLREKRIEYNRFLRFKGSRGCVVGIRPRTDIGIDDDDDVYDENGFIIESEKQNLEPVVKYELDDIDERYQQLAKQLSNILQKPSISKKKKTSNKSGHPKLSKKVDSIVSEKKITSLLEVSFD